MPLRKTKPSQDDATSPEVGRPALRLAPDAAPSILTDKLRQDHSQQSGRKLKPSQNDVLQVLLLFAALHDQFKKRTAPGTPDTECDARPCPAPFEGGERFDLDEVLKLIAERAVALTGADGVAIALGENNEIVLRAAAGAVRPGMGACIDSDSVFYRDCFSMAQVVTCDDTETDARVNLQMCRNLGARSMVAVPLRGRHRVIGLLGAFSAWPFGFKDRDVRNLGLLAELVLGALMPEEEERFAESAQIAATKLEQVPARGFVANVPREVDGFPQATPAAAEVSIRDETESTWIPAMASPDEPAFDERLDAECAVMRPPRKSDSRTYRSGTLFLVVSVFIAAALAGGVWRLSRMGHLSSGKMRPEKLRAQVDNSEHPSAASASPDRVANPNIGIDSAPHPPSNARGFETLPAGRQELSKSSRITGIRHWSSGDSSTVVFELEDRVEYEAHRLNHPERIYFDLHNTTLAADLVGKSIKVDDVLLRRIRIAQPAEGMTRIVLQTKIRSDFSVRLESNPCQLVVELRNVEEKSTGAMNAIPKGLGVWQQRPLGRRLPTLEK